MSPLRSRESAPLVSVITPVFNVSSYLEEAVRSVLAQTETDFEYILVDDGSTDGSFELALALAKTDSRITVLQIDHAGSGAARNAGLRRAQGRYVAFCDGDDRWAETFIATSVSTMEAAPTAVGATFTWFNRIGVDGISYGTVQITALGDFDTRAMLVGHCPPGNGSCLLIRRSCFDEAGLFDEELASCIDLEMWLRIGTESSSPLFRAIGQPLVDWRVRPMSISSNEQKRVRGLAEVMQKYGNLIADEDLARAFTWPAVLAFYAGEDDLARAWERIVRTADRWYAIRGGNSFVLGAMMVLGAPAGRRIRSLAGKLRAHR